MLIDSHCHFDFGAFDGEREALWQKCRSVGVGKTGDSRRQSR